MPKVLRILNRANLGGPIFNASYLTKYLAPKYETLLLVGQADKGELEFDEILIKNNLNYKKVTSLKRDPSFKDDINAYREIRKIIKEFKPDVVHTHAAKAGLIGRLAAKRSGVPVIVHTFHGHVFHSYFGKLKTKIYIYLERFLASISSAIISISELQKKELLEDFNICNPKKMNLIQLGLELDKFAENSEEKRRIFREKYQIANDEIAIGIIGRLAPVKNHALFINAIDQVLNNTQQKVKVLIVGDGEERESIAQLLHKKNIAYNYYPENSVSQTVCLTSWITDMAATYPGLDIIALSSLNEGTPVSLIEAQASGVPIVSTNVGGVTDVIIPNETGFLTEKTDVNLFAQYLLQLVNDEALRNKMGQKGFEHVKSIFDVSILAQNMDKLYSKLLSKKK